MSDILKGPQYLTLDGGALRDALWCLYWLAENEISRTKFFSGLRELCVLLGNTILTHTGISRNMTYQSKQSSVGETAGY